MTARQGPGGRIPNQGKGPQAKGVGKNAKRHDLERQATPGLAGSDLQQGDVQAMEQGQRIAPVRKQEAASPSPPGGGGGGRKPVKAPPGGAMPDTQSIIESRLGGTLGDPTRRRPTPDKIVDRARGWGQFFGELSRHTKAPGGLRSRARQQQLDLAALNPGPVSQVFDLAQADDEIDNFLTDQGF